MDKLEVSIQERIVNPTQALILAWERKQHRACDLCRWGVTQHAQVPDDQPMGESVRVCINPAVVGTQPGACVPVSFARYRHTAHDFSDLKRDMQTTHSNVRALGACGPEAKYLDFVGLHK